MNLLPMFQDMSDSVIIKILIILISSDVLFGVLRAIKEKTINSGIGIEGLIRKTTMLVAIVGLYLIDILININFVSIIPAEVITILNLPEVGLAELFGTILIAFESLSILKNINLIGLPLPKNIKKTLEKFLSEMTSET